MADLTNSAVKPNETTPKPPRDPDAKPVSWRGVVVLSLGMLLLILFLAYLLVNVWPCAGSDCEATTVRLFRSDFFTWYPSSETRLILVVLVAGALGSCIHAATSFVDYVGNNKLTWNWVAWYIMRPFIGMSLAVIFYLVIRGGFFASSSQAGNMGSSVNPYGIAAVAGMVGMFSKQATDKLSELFTTLFRTASGSGDEKRAGKLTDPKPTITSLEPLSITAGSPAFTLRVKGTNFVKESKVRFGDSERKTDFKSGTELVASILAEDVATQGDKLVTVQNPTAAGGVSNPQTFVVSPKA